MTMRFRHVIVVAALSIVGCGESVESSSVSTDGIYADFSATADGSGQTRVHAGLQTGGPASNTFLTLSDGDRLRFHADGKTRKPNVVDIFGQYEVYERDLDPDAGGTEFRISLQRKYAKDAPESTVTLPKPFQIEAPTATESFSRADDAIEVTLANSDDDADHFLEVTGECLHGLYRLKFDGTSATIDPGDLDADPDDNAPSKCSARLAVFRQTTGSVDPAFSGGSFVATQKRVASFKSTP